MAKFWLEPIVALATFHNLTTKDLRKIEIIVMDIDIELEALEHPEQFPLMFHKK